MQPKPRSSGLLEALHVGASLTEQEDLDRDVVLDVGLAEEGPHGASGRLLHDARELLGHALLEAAPDVLDRLALTALYQRPLGAREALLQDHRDQIVGDVGLR